jgi:hypothetical protein
MKKFRLVSAVILFTLVAFNMPAAEQGAGETPVAEVMVGPNGINWSPNVQYSKLILTVSRPDGQVVKKTFTTGAVPGYDLGSDGLPVLDGSYTYELRVIPVLATRGPEQDAVRMNSVGPVGKKALTQSGFFSVQGGMIVTPGLIEPETTLSTGQDEMSRTMDIVHNDDVIITFSLCVGNDCVNGESFGFDTFRLKENNLRIHFQDTSNSASFPTNDWRIVINDSSNGGASYFRVEDSTAGRNPFTIEAGAPSNSLYVDDGGRLGLGTSTPVVEVHVKDGDTPTLRLEQDGSSGFTPQTWDVAGNETNFFVRDVTNGSKLSFRIKPSAPTDSLFIDTNGDIGIGTDSPEVRLHMLTDSSTNAKMFLERSSGAKGQVTAAAANMQIGTANDFPVRIVANGGWKMELTSAGRLNMSTNTGGGGGGYYDETNGDWTNGSSREYKENIAELKADDAVTAFSELKPVTFKYKGAPKGDSQVGFIAEDVPELVAKRDRKGLAPMDIVAVITKVLQEQYKLNEQQQKTIAELKKRVAELEKKSK